MASKGKAKGMGMTFFHDDLGPDMTIDPNIAKQRKELARNLKFLAIIILAVFVVLAGRVGYLQFFNSEALARTSETNRIKFLPISHIRGDIEDKNGVLLATSQPVFNAYLTYQGVSNKESEKVIALLTQILGENDERITPEYVKELIKQQQSRLYEPILVKRNLTEEEVARLEERRAELPGVLVQKGPLRHYPPFRNYQLAGHVLGYVREISPEELERHAEDDYRMGDLIGKFGLERGFEQYLRGVDGYQKVEVNSKNRPIREFFTQSPEQGYKVSLTLDVRLQHAMEEALDQTMNRLQEKENPKAQAAAAVMIDVRTGALLAMGSRPALNPNDFTGNLTQEQADYYHRIFPPAFINRAIQAAYPPGSTFKPITALAALESGNLGPRDTVHCTGAYWEKPYIKCWSVHGTVNLYSGMAGSCNVYFQEAARRAGIDNINRIAKDFGLGEETGISLPGEVEGLLPGRDWKKTWGTSYTTAIYKGRLKELDKQTEQKLAEAKSEEEKQQIVKKADQRRKQIESEFQIQLNFNSNWQLYETFNTGIGQGNNQYTILQLANYIATLANGGSRYRPYLVDKIVDQQNNLVKRFEPELLNQVSASPRNMALVRDAMVAVASPGGTAHYLFQDFPFKVGAKTGTAEPGRKGDDPEKDYHGLFVAFAPADNPEVAFAGVVEYGYHGGSSAGLIARAVFEEYFGLAKTNDPSVFIPFGRVEE